MDKKFLLEEKLKTIQDLLFLTDKQTQDVQVPIVTIQSRICSTCHVEKPLDDFYKSKTGGLKHLYKCKSCIAETVRKRNNDFRTMPSIPKEKICSACGISKSLDKFHNSKFNSDGKSYECKICLNNYQKNYATKAKEKFFNKISDSIWQQFETIFCINKEINSKKYDLFIQDTFNVDTADFRRNAFLEYAQYKGYVVVKKRYGMKAGSYWTIRIYKDIPIKNKTVNFERNDKPEIGISDGSLPLINKHEVTDERMTDSVINDPEKRKLFWRK